ncbi:glycosyltransferase [Silvibacterium dinghuense]|uniref:Glycosyltransferase n=1 Tax=Silvibacterium dinghuense TaxID=1560006 RepID=A0A4Q1SH53_9BACT|nr:glycosyltransferase [Silvibacterium dinghuense]RXS96699.1 glycosyltransferase [Silvibacterium dinghuense]
MKRVLIYRADLLPPSETFITGQTASLQRYTPWFAGLRRYTKGLTLDASRVLSVTKGNNFQDKLIRRAYLLSRISPSFHRKVQQIRPSLIHAHFAPDGSLALKVQKLLDVPLIVTLHGFDVTKGDEAFRDSLFGRMYLSRRADLWQQASLFVCVSEHIRQMALERGFPEDKLLVHRIGIDLTRFLPAEKQEPIVLFVGRMVEKKGAIHLVRAMQSVQAHLPHARLVLLGDGPLKPELEEEARKLGVKAEFLGMQPHNEVISWMRRAQVLAAPSIVARSGDSEGLPTVMCEAQAMGLPVVSFRGPGVDEAVVHGETALLAAPGDDRELGEAITRLLSDPQLLTQFGEAGQRRAAEFFDIRHQTALLEDIYDRVVDAATRRIA